MLDLTTLQLDCSTLFDSELHSDVFTEDLHSVYQWFYFVVIPSVQFEVIHEQQMIDFTVTISQLVACTINLMPKSQLYLLLVRHMMYQLIH